jgi:hypothetical protein
MDILNIIPGKKRHTASGWWSFNAPCCVHRGHRSDQRSRGGIVMTGQEWKYHCFNCHYKCGYTPGNSIGKSTKQFLLWCGVDEEQINQWNLDSIKNRASQQQLSTDLKPFVANFETRQLPPCAIKIDPKNTHHDMHINYLKSRGLKPDSYTYYAVEDAARSGIIIPYYYNGQIVGNTIRFYDNRTPKYIKDVQRNYVFNIDAQNDKRSVCILVEGEFDAISIDGCAYMGSTISDGQAQLLSRLRKQIIVVPDRDSSGLAICERAKELGYSVSIPEWDIDVKDVNDAVKRYGRLTTTLSILESATTSVAKMMLLRNKILKEKR